MGVKELTDNKRNSQSYYALAISFYLLYGLEETVAFSGYEGFAILEEIDAEITEETCGLKEFEVDNSSCFLLLSNTDTHSFFSRSPMMNFFSIVF